MSIIYNKKVSVEFNRNDELVLDGQSRICNWFYNKLLSECKDDYENHNNEKQLLSGRNLRNYGVTLKEEYPFLKTVHSSVLKEPSTRLKKSYDSFFAGNTGYPNYRSWKNKWFSLVYDEPDKGWELRDDGTKIALALGKIPDMPKEKGCANPYIVGQLKEKVELQPGELLKTFSLVKQHGKFYAVFAVERCSNEELEHKAKMTEYRKLCNQMKKDGKDKSELPKAPKLETEDAEIPEDCKWIAIDPNHENFFVGVDYMGRNIRFEKLAMIKYWDNVIDRLKSMRDVCQKNYRKYTTESGSKYTVHSPRWNRLNRALEAAYDARREQIKSALYSISHLLYDEYDLVCIGDYTPTNDTAPYDTMKRSMLNQEQIGSFRRTLEWVATKRGKFYLLIDERNTTKECCNCGYEEKKDLNVRGYTCPQCGTKVKRDSGSAVNIGKKAKRYFDMNKYKNNLSNFTHKGKVLYSRKATINPV